MRGGNKVCRGQNGTTASVLSPAHTLRDLRPISPSRSLVSLEGEQDCLQSLSKDCRVINTPWTNAGYSPVCSLT